MPPRKKRRTKKGSADQRWEKATPKNLGLDRPMSVGGWPEGEYHPSVPDQLKKYYKDMGLMERVLILLEKEIRGQKDKRVLYHIAMSGPKPPRPIPKMKWIMEWDAQAVDRHTGEKTGEDVRVAPDNSWKRHWLDQPIESGIFLSPNWKAISSFHGRIGHVYAFKVPEWVIKKAGGIHRYDHGSEILISEEIWDEAGDDIEFLGKSVDVDDVFDAYEHSYGDTSATVNRRGTPRSPSWLDAEELEAWKAKQKEFNLYGLRQTNHPKDVIKLLKPDEVKAAMVAFEKAYPEALTGKKHKTEWEKQPEERQGYL